MGLQAPGIREANMMYCGLALRLAFKELMLKSSERQMGLIENNSALVKSRHGEVGCGSGLEYLLHLQCDLFSSASSLNCASSVTMAMMNDKKSRPYT